MGIEWASWIEGIVIYLEWNEFNDANYERLEMMMGGNFSFKDNDLTTNRCWKHNRIVGDTNLHDKGTRNFNK